MSVSYVQKPTGIQAVPAAQQQALVAALSGLSAPIVIDASEGEGRSLASIVSFIQSGGIWVSWGGDPFYYTPSQPGGLGYNFSRFCTLLGVPDPNGSAPGSEFFGPPNGNSRILWTPAGTTSLPSPWVAGMPSQSVGNQVVWPLIAVPSGSGWWFYASVNYATITPAQYAAFIQSLAQPVVTAVSSTAVPASSSPRSLPWGWIIAGGALAIGVGAVVVIERH